MYLSGNVVFVGNEEKSEDVAGEVAVVDVWAKEDFCTEVCGTWWDGKIFGV